MQPILLFDTVSEGLGWAISQEKSEKDVRIGKGTAIIHSHNSPNLETTHKSINRGMEECIVIYSYKETLCCSNREQRTDTCKNVG